MSRYLIPRPPYFSGLLHTLHFITQWPPLTLFGSSLLNSRSLPHRLGRGCRILSRHEREREGVRDTPSWVTGPHVGAGGGVVAMATVGVVVVRAAARTRSRQPSGRQQH
jgi:hypothetical protein